MEGLCECQEEEQLAHRLWIRGHVSGGERLIDCVYIQLGGWVAATTEPHELSIRPLLIFRGLKVSAFPLGRLHFSSMV